MVEHLVRNQRVTGSTPAISKLKDLTKKLLATNNRSRSEGSADQVGGKGCMDAADSDRSRPGRGKQEVCRWKATPAISKQKDLTKKLLATNKWSRSEGSADQVGTYRPPLNEIWFRLNFKFFFHLKLTSFINDIYC